MTSLYSFEEIFNELSNLTTIENGKHGCSNCLFVRLNDKFRCILVDITYMINEWNGLI